MPRYVCPTCGRSYLTAQQAYDCCADNDKTRDNSPKSTVETKKDNQHRSKHS